MYDTHEMVRSANGNTLPPLVHDDDDDDEDDDDEDEDEDNDDDDEMADNESS